MSRRSSIVYGEDLPAGDCRTLLVNTAEVLIEPVGQCLTAEVAERLVALRANPELQLEVDRLADKANRGTVTEEERTQYEQYVSFAQFVTLLQIEARDLLDGRSGAV